MGDYQKDRRYCNKIVPKLAGWVSHKDPTAMLPIAGPRCGVVVGDQENQDHCSTIHSRSRKDSTHESVVLSKCVAYQRFINDVSSVGHQRRDIP